jgi:hypothetical protein
LTSLIESKEDKEKVDDVLGNKELLLSDDEETKEKESEDGSEEVSSDENTDAAQVDTEEEVPSDETAVEPESIGSEEEETPEEGSEESESSEDSEEENEDDSEEGGMLIKRVAEGDFTALVDDIMSVAQAKIMDRIEQYKLDIIAQINNRFKSAVVNIVDEDEDNLVDELHEDDEDFKDEDLTIPDPVKYDSGEAEDDLDLAAGEETPAEETPSEEVPAGDETVELTTVDMPSEEESAEVTPEVAPEPVSDVVPETTPEDDADGIEINTQVVDTNTDSQEFDISNELDSLNNSDDTEEVYVDDSDLDLSDEEIMKLLSDD